MYISVCVCGGVSSGHLSMLKHGAFARKQVAFLFCFFPKVLETGVWLSCMVKEGCVWPKWFGSMWQWHTKKIKCSFTRWLQMAIKTKEWQETLCYWTRLLCPGIPGSIILLCSTKQVQVLHWISKVKWQDHYISWHTFDDIFSIAVM